MKTLVKFAALGLVLSSGSAFALDLPSTGNSSVALFVQDQTDLTRTAVLDLGLHLNDFMAESAVNSSFTGTAGTVASTLSYATQTVSSSSLAGFMTAGTTYKYALFAYDDVSSSANGTIADPYRYLTSSNLQISSTAKSTLKNNALGDSSLGGLVNSAFSETNDTLAGGTFATGTGFNQDGFAAGGLPSSFGNAVATSLVDVGTASKLYIFTTGSSTGTQTARVYQGLDVTLNLNGSVSGLASTSSAPPVPLPAGIWLLGSALAGLGSIARRRRVAA